MSSRFGLDIKVRLVTGSVVLASNMGLEARLVFKWTFATCWAHHLLVGAHGVGCN